MQLPMCMCVCVCVLILQMLGWFLYNMKWNRFFCYIWKYGYFANVWLIFVHRLLYIVYCKRLLHIVHRLLHKSRHADWSSSLLHHCANTDSITRSLSPCLWFSFVRSVREMKNNMCWQHLAWTPKKALMSDEWNLLGDEFCERRCCASLVNIMLPAFGEIAKKGRKFEDFFWQYIECQLV